MAAPPRALGERCRFCPSSSSPLLPFRESAGLGGGREGVSVGLRDSSLPAPSALFWGLALHPANLDSRWGRPQPANFRTACAVCVLDSPGGSSGGYTSKCLTARDVARRPGVGPPRVLKLWSAAEGVERLALAPGLTDVKEEKRFPFVIAGR